jgi:hypothetical protein
MTEAKTRFCMNCGKAVKTEISICPFCWKPTGSSTPSLSAATQRIYPTKAQMNLPAITFIAFLVGVVVGVGFTPRGQIAVVTQTVTQTPTAILTATPTASPPSTPVNYLFNGTGSRTTETFTIPTTEWKLEVTTRGQANPMLATISVYIYPERAGRGGHIAEAGHNGDGKDYTIIRNGPGKYYLDIISANCQWTITVTAPP